MKLKTLFEPFDTRLSKNIFSLPRYNMLRIKTMKNTQQASYRREGKRKKKKKAKKSYMKRKHRVYLVLCQRCQINNGAPLCVCCCCIIVLFVLLVGVSKLTMRILSSFPLIQTINDYRNMKKTYVTVRLQKPLRSEIKSSSIVQSFRNLKIEPGHPFYLFFFPVLGHPLALLQQLV